MKAFIPVFLILVLSGSLSAQTEINPLLTYSTPLVVGYRGGFDVSLPENSISMFEYTYENADRKPIGIEFDIRESVSGSLYIMHDSIVDRTTNGTGKITLLTDAYLESLFLRDRNGNLTKEKIPMFIDILDHFKDKNIILMLDIKGNIYPKVIDLIVQKRMQAKCILLTFSKKNTKLVKEMTNEILISALIQNKADWESLHELQIPEKQLIAYINHNAPADLITEIENGKVTLMTDVSEGIRNTGKCFETGYYRDLVASLHLGIVICDYPQYVNKIFYTK